ncbi:MAG: family 10 glycosylhydrolase [Pirellulales bacterium]|nr:family 10 glycosylhydrolase [Pirellulales bacterium]
MPGHGSPKSGLESMDPRLFPASGGGGISRRSIRRILLLLILVQSGIFLFQEAIIPNHATSAEVTTRIRIAWGGGSRFTSWEGRIAVDRGRLLDPQPLGMEPDVPGSMWLDHGSLSVARRSPRLYDGVDITAAAPEDANLIVTLTPLGKDQPIRVDIPLVYLRTRTHRAVLDDQNNYLLVQRAPGDTMRIEIDRDPLILNRNDSFRFSLDVDLPNIGPEVTIELTAFLRPARSDQSLWSGTYSLSGSDVSPPARSPSDGTRRVEIEVPLAVEEGVYTIELSASIPKRLAGRFIPRISEKPLAKRQIQFVVLDTNRIPTTNPEDWHFVAEIDPTNPRWWNRIPKWVQLEKLPGMPHSPLTNGAIPFDLPAPIDRGIELPAKNSNQEPIWWAYPLPVEITGKPHMLEIDLPGTGEFDLGVSILEPDAAGRLISIGRDWGVHRDAVEWAPETSPGQTYRAIFWPRTSAPLLVLSNLHTTKPALFRQIRVFSRNGDLPRSNSETLAGLSGRQVAGYYDKPLLAEAFGATTILDPQTGLAIDDWQTFYEVASRLTQYSHFAGYNTAVVSVLSDGSALFPSQSIQSALLYDTGLLSSHAQDPRQKDFLELLLRLFDNDGLSLIPALQFNAPLPELEALRRTRQSPVDGIEWIGMDGRTWLQTHGMQYGKGPYYNLLNDQVQHAILKIVREITQRYGTHSSLAGIALQLSNESYTQLPGPEWGFDDATIAQFQEETKLRVPGDGTGRFQQRAAFLLGPQREAWLAWRSEQVAKFYNRLRKEIGAVNSRRTLYLIPARTLDSPAVRVQLGPALPERLAVERSYQELGLNLATLGKESDALVLRPYYDTSNSDPRQPVDLRINSAIQMDHLLKESPQIGIQVFQRTQKVQLPSLSQKNVFGPNAIIASFDFQTHAVGTEARQNMIRALCLHDAVVLVHGGNVLPTAFDSDLRQTMATFQRLPHPSRLAATKSCQPVILRIYDEPDATVLCVINDSPWPMDLTIPLQAPAGCGMIDLPYGNRPFTVPTGGDGMHWTVHLNPYDIRAARFSETGVRATDIEFRVDHSVREQLAQAINTMEQRALIMAQSRSFDALVNPDFESQRVGTTIPGWQLDDASHGVRFDLDDRNPFEGTYAARLSSDGPPASLVSDPIAVPETSRLAIRARLRAHLPHPQPEFRIMIEEIGRGASFRQYTVLGGNGSHALPLQENWVNYYEFPVENLPVIHPNKLQIRFSLLGSGTIWIDGIELFDLNLVDHPGHNERLELFKIVNQARNDYVKNRYSDCVHTLEGYWPQFLRRHIPLEEMTDFHQVQQNLPASEPDVADRLKQFVPKFLRR